MATSGVFHDRPPTVLDKLGRLNWSLLIIVTLLAAVGLAALYSVAGGSWSPWAERHALRFLLGFALVVVMAVVPPGFYLRIAYPVYAVALVSLILVPVLGNEALGARRWLQLGSVSFQPSELMKVAIVLLVATFAQARRRSDISRPHVLAVVVFLILLPMGLIIRQPDLGTALLIGAMGFGLLMLAGVNLLYFLGGAAGLMAALPMAIPYLHDYQRRRIETFLDPSSDPLGAGYHVTQSKIALGSGGLTGKGFLGGTQSQLDFLPEKHTDFIFTTIAEEWGFVGAVTVIGLFAVLLVVLAAMALSTTARAGRLLIGGAMLAVGTYATINIGMVSGVFPVVGVPLPFISYGGTSMMTLMMLLGLAMSAWVHRDDRLPVPEDRG